MHVPGDSGGHGPPPMTGCPVGRGRPGLVATADTADSAVGAGMGLGANWAALDAEGLAIVQPVPLDNGAAAFPAVDVVAHAVQAGQLPVAPGASCPDLSWRAISDRVAAGGLRAARAARR